MQKKTSVLLFSLLIFLCAGQGQIMVSNCSDFQNIQYQAINGMISNNITLTNDIDCSSLPYFNLSGTSFSGFFEGNNHTIKNLFVNNASGAYLFCHATNATFQNILFHNVSFISTNNSASILANIFYDTNMFNVQATGCPGVINVIQGAMNSAYPAAFANGFYTGMYSGKTVVVKGCGVSYTNITSDSDGAGCIFQYVYLGANFDCSTIFDQLFCSSSTTVTSSGVHGQGGLFYHFREMNEGSSFSSPTLTPLQGSRLWRQLRKRFQQELSTVLTEQVPQ